LAGAAKRRGKKTVVAYEPPYADDLALDSTLFRWPRSRKKKLVDLAAENKIAKKNWLRFPEASFNF
jgi:hypothetical protein